MEDTTVLIATGTHRANTPGEIEAMLGAEIRNRCRVVCHDARDPSTLIRAGSTSTGVPVFLNRLWLDSEFRITTGFVEPHFFAGFSGGPKMVAPGLAGLETVMQLHDAPRIAHPRATWGIVEGNPIQDDVREIVRMTGVDFSVDVTLDRDQRITGVFAGDLFQAHAQACAQVRETAFRPVEGLFDVVLTSNSGYPLDQNLYQAVKGISAAAQIIKPGGTIICAAECRDGVPAGSAYERLLMARPAPQELLDLILSARSPLPDQWQVQIQAQIQLRARVWIKSDGLSHNAIREAHFEPVEDLDTAIERAMREAGPSARLCVLPEGPQTVPYRNTSNSKVVSGSTAQR